MPTTDEDLAKEQEENDCIKVVGNELVVILMQKIKQFI